MPTGSSTKLNKVSGLAVLMTVNNDAIQQQLPATFPKGTPVYNENTRELLVATEDKQPLHQLKDHLHPYTHAPLVHSHMYGANQAWFITEARLWYRPDLHNHPELIPLDGQELSDDQATYLAEVYPGTRLATDIVTSESDTVASNDEMTLTVSSLSDGSATALTASSTIDLDNFHVYEDQWLANGTDTEQSIILQFKNAIVYRPVKYIISPAVGTADGTSNTLHPTPQSWVFEGSNNGTSWTELDTQTETDNNWVAYGMREFTVDTDQTYSYFRLKITQWFGGTGNAGLKRLLVVGHKNGAFSAPYIPAPSNEFVWVLPIRDQDIGLKHEDVGDINFTSVLPANLPSYRLPTDGRELSKTDYPELYAAIGHRADTAITVSQLTTENGTTGGGQWNSNATDENTSTSVLFTLDTPSAIGYYHWDTTGYRQPKDWTVEVNDGTEWHTIQTMSAVVEGDIAAANGIIYIDTTVEDITATQIRITVTNWHPTGTEPFGFNAVTLYGHSAGMFHIPNISFSSNSMMPYIVSRNTANDVTSVIISDLQNNIIDLTTALATLQNRVDTLDPEISGTTETTD